MLNYVLKYNKYFRLNNQVGRIWQLNEHKNLHFDHHYDIHMSYKKNYEVYGNGHDLDLLLVLSACFVIAQEKRASRKQ